MTTRELKQITTNLITLYLRGAYRDQLIYQGLLERRLSPHELGAVKQAFRAFLINR